MCIRDRPMVGIDSLLITNVNSFNRLKMTITYNQATPVELTSFTINVSENTVNLNWQTATETNNQGFAIERKQVFSQQSSVNSLQPAMKNGMQLVLLMEMEQPQNRNLTLLLIRTYLQEYTSTDLNKLITMEHLITQMKLKLK